MFIYYHVSHNLWLHWWHVRIILTGNIMVQLYVVWQLRPKSAPHYTFQFRSFLLQELNVYCIWLVGMSDQYNCEQTTENKLEMWNTPEILRTRNDTLIGIYLHWQGVVGCIQFLLYNIFIKLVSLVLPSVSSIFSIYPHWLRMPYIFTTLELITYLFPTKMSQLRHQSATW